MDDLEKLKAKLMKKKGFKRAYEDLQPEMDLITSVIKLRKKRRLTQKELARKLYTTQSVVARLENPYYGKASLPFLKRVAKALDARLVIKLQAK